ncbi:MAG: TrkA family potassium uptake protein [Anaerolineae bacterium]|nr:TrkA family potassium uptake protein [Anaerolineae bacterium]
MKFIVVGCGRQGSYLALTLVRAGHEVTVIDDDSVKLARLPATFKGRVIQGVVFDRDVLINAGVERVDGLAAVSDNDDANIVAALLARNVFHVPQVVARVFDPHQAEIYARLGLTTTSPVELGAAQFMQMLTHRQMEAEFTFGSGQVHLVRLDVPAHLVGHRVDELTVFGEFAVVSFTRQNRALLAVPGMILEAGDTLHVAVQAGAMDRLSALIGIR